MLKHIMKPNYNFFALTPINVFDKIEVEKHFNETSLTKRNSLT